MTTRNGNSTILTLSEMELTIYLLMSSRNISKPELFKDQGSRLLLTKFPASCAAKNAARVSLTQIIDGLKNGLKLSAPISHFQVNNKKRSKSKTTLERDQIIRER